MADCSISKTLNSNGSHGDSEEEESRPQLKRAATKKRHFTRPIEEIKPCGIYSSAAANIALPQITDNLPDSDIDDEDCQMQPTHKKKRQTRQTRNLRNKRSSQAILLDSDEEDIINYGTPKKSTHVVSRDSPCSPPPPPDPGLTSQRPLEHDRETTKVLRSINVALTNVRCIQNEVSSQSDDAFSPVARTPGGSVAVIDVDAPSPVRRRNSIVAKVRSRSRIHRFQLKMSDTFSQVIDSIASQEGVRRECVKLARDGQDINEFDTPRSVNLHIADIIDCLIVDSGTLHDATSTEQTVEVTIQGKKKNSSMTRTIRRDETLQKVMEEYSELFQIPMARLRFSFDGDTIYSNDTPTLLDFEEDMNTIDAIERRVV